MVLDSESSARTRPILGPINARSSNVSRSQPKRYAHTHNPPEAVPFLTKAPIMNVGNPIVIPKLMNNNSVSLVPLRPIKKPEISVPLTKMPQTNFDNSTLTGHKTPEKSFSFQKNPSVKSRTSLQSTTSPALKMQSFDFGQNTPDKGSSSQKNPSFTSTPIKRSGNSATLTNSSVGIKAQNANSDLMTVTKMPEKGPPQKGPYFTTTPCPQTRIAQNRKSKSSVPSTSSSASKNIQDGLKVQKTSGSSDQKPRFTPTPVCHALKDLESKNVLSIKL